MEILQLTGPRAEEYRRLCYPDAGCLDHYSVSTDCATYYTQDATTSWLNWMLKTGRVVGLNGLIKPAKVIVVTLSPLPVESEVLYVSEDMLQRIQGDGSGDPS